MARVNRLRFQELLDTVAELKADHNLLRTALLNGCHGSPGLAEGTNANTIKTTRATAFSIAGVLYNKAITDNIAMTAATAQADLTYRLYLVSIDAAGAVTITAGTAVATDTATLPALPASSAMLGYFKVATSGGTFTSGTTDLSGTGVTATFVDLLTPNSGSAEPTAVTNTSPASVDSLYAV